MVLLETVPTASEPPALPTFQSQDEPSLLPEFEQLLLQNPDIIGWLKIQGTSISYPVMYSPQDPEFYLSHDFDKQASNSGLPFLDYRCSIDSPTSNWIIHGHNMKKPIMFHDLIHYKDAEYYEAHPIIQFDTLYEQMEYEIIAVIVSKVYPQNEDVFKYYQFINAETQMEYDLFIQNIKELALYDTGKTAKFNDQLITLSTCEYSSENGRLAVIARKK